MKITKDKLLQIIKEETLALMERIKHGYTTTDKDWPHQWKIDPEPSASENPEDAGYPGRYGKGAYERPSFPLPKKEDPEVQARAAKIKADKARQEPSELDRILAPDTGQELDPKTLAWIDNLIKKPDGLEQLQTFMRSLK